MDTCAAVCEARECHIVWTHVLLSDVGACYIVWTHVLLSDVGACYLVWRHNNNTNNKSNLYSAIRH